MANTRRPGVGGPGGGLGGSRGGSRGVGGGRLSKALRTRKPLTTTDKAKRAAKDRERITGKPATTKSKPKKKWGIKNDRQLGELFRDMGKKGKLPWQKKGK